MLLEQIRENGARLGDRPALCAGGRALSWGALWPEVEKRARTLAEGTGPVFVEAARRMDTPVEFLACLRCERPYVPLDPEAPAARRAEIRRVAEGLALPAGTAYVMFTSGSTGAPKPVPITVGNLENFLGWAAALPGASAAGGVCVGAAPYSFDLSVADLYLSLLWGGTHVGLTGEEKGDFPALFRRLEASGGTFLAATPSFLRLCLLDRGFHRGLLPRLETVFSCGEELPPGTAARLLERFPGLTLLNAYGPTEATCAVCAAEITPELCGRARLPVGRRGAGAVDISVENGEILLRGGSISPAWGPVYATGDRGYWEDGELYCAGRLDDQIKYKGYRIEPGEIERALEALPGVERAAVLPRRDRAGRVLGLRAFYEGAAEPAQLSAALAGRLPGYMVPGQWRRLARLPLNPNGKIDRNGLEGAN